MSLVRRIALPPHLTWVNRPVYVDEISFHHLLPANDVNHFALRSVCTRNTRPSNGIACKGIPAVSSIMGLTLLTHDNTKGRPCVLSCNRTAATTEYDIALRAWFSATMCAPSKFMRNKCNPSLREELSNVSPLDPRPPGALDVTGACSDGLPARALPT